MYRAIDKPSYTRREYITGIPGSKIAQYKMGEVDSNEDDYPVQISLIVEEECQIRHGALEAPAFRRTASCSRTSAKPATR